MLRFGFTANIAFVRDITQKPIPRPIQTESISKKNNRPDNTNLIKPILQSFSRNPCRLPVSLLQNKTHLSSLKNLRALITSTRSFPTFGEASWHGRAIFEGAILTCILRILNVNLNQNFPFNKRVFCEFYHLLVAKPGSWNSCFELM